MTEKLSGRSQALHDTRLGRLYRRLYVHPSRFDGDLQRQTGIVNHHRRLRQFGASFLETARRLLDLGSGSRRLRSRTLDTDIRRLPGVGVVADAYTLFLDDLLPRRAAEQLVAGAVYFEGFKA